MSDTKTQIIPHLTIRDAVGAIDFYAKAFGAEEVSMLTAPDGFVMHAAISIGGALVYLTGELLEYGATSPQTLGGSAVTVHMQVADADAVYNRAVEAGCTIAMPLDDMFWGDRYGMIVDPYGHKWSIATTKSRPTPEEIHQAMVAAMAAHSAGDA